VRALVRPGKKFGLGKTVKLTSSITAEVLAIDDEGVRTLKLSKKITDKGIDAYRLTPFPPYIEQNEQLSGEYQTVYADSVGSKAAPTAGLHFTPQMLEALAERGVEIARVTLHVGLGTFAPLRVERVDEVRLHRERYTITPEAAAQINTAARSGRRIVSVGTTVVRTLEAAALAASGNPGDKSIWPHSGATDIFISPGFEFRLVDALLTNFHLPQSSLLMLVSAFAGRERVLAAYRHAIQERYRFYSYGDCMFIA